MIRKFCTIAVSVVAALLPFNRANAQYPNAYVSDIDWSYYNINTIFATYPGYTLFAPQGSGVINGTLGSNAFTASFTNLANLGNGTAATGATGQGVQIASALWGPLIWTTSTNNFYTSQANYIDLSWRGSGTSGAATAIPAGSSCTVTFINNLDMWDQLIVADVGDGDEEVGIEFLDAAGNPVNLLGNVQPVHLTNDAAGQSAPITYNGPLITPFGATQILINNGGLASGSNNEGWAFVMTTNNIKSVRLTQTGNISANAGNSWAFSFAKGAFDSGDAPARYGAGSIFSLGGLVRLGAHGGDTEYNPLYSAGADGDNKDNNNDEDGVSTITPIPNNGVSGQVIPAYTASATVTNRSSYNATVQAWIDWDGNGVFDPGEAATPLTVPPASINVPVTLTWNNAVLGGATGTAGTYMRITVTSGILIGNTPSTATVAATASKIVKPTITGGVLPQPIGETEDYFIPFAIPLPVSFGNIMASIHGNTLQVNWQSLTETNNDHFEVEASADGKNFTKIGEVKSRAMNGNSNAVLDYSFSTDKYAGSLMMSGSILAMLALGMGFVRRKVAAAGIATMLSFVLLVTGCSKGRQDVQSAVNGKIYIRIAQVDIDGKKSYSKVVLATKE